MDSLYPSALYKFLLHAVRKELFFGNIMEIRVGDVK